MQAVTKTSLVDDDFQVVKTRNCFTVSTKSTLERTEALFYISIMSEMTSIDSIISKC